jgi:hypothetical protein
MTETTAPPRIIGFDLGHAETALTVINDPRGVELQRLDPPFAAGRPVSVTAVAERPDGITVGHRAIEDRTAQALYVGFKSPELHRESVARPTRLFVGGVRDELDRHGLVRRDRPTLWVFGVPSGWDSTVSATYRDLLAGEGLDYVDVVAESRAAMLYARDSGEFKIDMSGLMRSVVVIDLGSSTADYTIVEGLTVKPLDTGSRLGAGLIDKAIMSWVLQAHPKAGELRHWLDQDPTTEWARLELVCRWAKEDYFRNEAASRPEDHVSGGQIYKPMAGNGAVMFEIVLTRDVMAHVLSHRHDDLDGLTWPEKLRHDLDTVTAVVNGAPEIVLMTGGASRMPFARDVVRSMFGGDPVVIGSEPELAIARGLALAGRIGFRAAGFRADIDALLASGEIEALVRNRLPELGQGIGEVVADGFVERYVLPAFARFKSGDIGTLSQLEREVTGAVQADLADANPGIQAAVAAWQNATAADLVQLTDPVCDRWRLPRSALALDRVSLDADDVDSQVSVSHHLTGVAGGIAAVVAGVVTYVVGIIVAAMLVTGPIGAWFALAALGAGVWMAARKGREAAMEALKDKEIPQAARALLNENKLRRSAPEVESQLRTDVANQIVTAGGDELVEKISRLLQANLRQQADEAELLIS